MRIGLRRAWRGALALTAAVIACPLITGAAGHAATPAPRVADSVDVSYHGYHISVPSDWRVVDVEANPRTCVRFDQPTVYLGAPSAEQDCMVQSPNTTDALVVQPLNAVSAARSSYLEHVDEDRAAPKAVNFSASNEANLAISAAGVLVTARYGRDAGTVTRIVASAWLDASARAVSADSYRPQAAQAEPGLATLAGTGASGLGFDACAAPSSSTMSAWQSSPYRTVGIYIGGKRRSCAQPNLTASWVSTQSANGWSFLPLYVGSNAAFGDLSSTSQAASAAAAEAGDAATIAASLGLGPGSVLYYDMEAYDTSLNSVVLTYFNAWTSTLHSLGYRSGIYSSLSSGIALLVDNYGTNSPDVVYFANWNGSQSTSDSAIPASMWVNHQRVHQYQGGHTETYGGVSINIDNDICDVANAAGSRVGVVHTGGEVYVKEGALSAAWSHITDSGTQVALAGDRVGVVHTDGSVYVKEGALSATWVHITDGVVQMALSGDRIGVVHTDGSVYVKEGALSAAWSHVTDGTSEIVLAGDRIGVVHTGGEVYVKEGALSAAWSHVTDGGTQVALG